MDGSQRIDRPNRHHPVSDNTIPWRAAPCAPPRRAKAAPTPPPPAAAPCPSPLPLLLRRLLLLRWQPVRPRAGYGAAAAAGTTAAAGLCSGAGRRAPSAACGTGCGTGAGGGRCWCLHRGPPSFWCVPSDPTESICAVYRVGRGGGKRGGDEQGRGGSQHIQQPQHDVLSLWAASLGGWGAPEPHQPATALSWNKVWMKKCSRSPTNGSLGKEVDLGDESLEWCWID